MNELTAQVEMKTKRMTDEQTRLQVAAEQAHRELVEAGGMYYYNVSPETHAALADAQATYIQARNLFEQALES